MKAIERLSQIKNLLGMDSNINLAQLKLENGTILEAEEFKSGQEVFILSDDEKIALPVGEYQLENGEFLSVTELGVIDEIKAEEHEEKEEAPKEEKKEEEEKVEAEYVTREEFRKEMDELKKHIEEMMDHKDKEKEDLSNEVATLMAEELSKQPATQPIKHSPDKTKPVNLKKYSQNRSKNTTMDRIMERISQIKN